MGRGSRPTSAPVERVLSGFSVPESLDSDQATENELQSGLGFKKQRAPAYWTNTLPTPSRVRPGCGRNNAQSYGTTCSGTSDIVHTRSTRSPDGERPSARYAPLRGEVGHPQANMPMSALRLATVPSKYVRIPPASASRAIRLSAIAPASERRVTRLRQRIRPAARRRRIIFAVRPLKLRMTSRRRRGAQGVLTWLDE